LAMILVGMCAGDQEACAIERVTSINPLKIIKEVRKLRDYTLQHTRDDIYLHSCYKRRMFA
jgi:hypothetical protein